jgi:hypothetical protein
VDSSEKVLPAVRHVQEPVFVAMLVVHGLQRGHGRGQRARAHKEEDRLLAAQLDPLRVHTRTYTCTCMRFMETVSCFEADGARGGGAGTARIGYGEAKQGAPLSLSPRPHSPQVRTHAHLPDHIHELTNCQVSRHKKLFLQNRAHQAGGRSERGRSAGKASCSRPGAPHFVDVGQQAVTLPLVHNHRNSVWVFCANRIR